MDPSSLPTDNLYKFVALSGIALVAFTLWLRWKLQNELEADLLSLMISKAKSEAAVSHLSSLESIENLKEDLLQKQAAPLKAKIAQGTATAAEVEELNTKLKAATEAAIERLKAQYPVSAEIRVGNATADGLKTKVQAFKKIKRQSVMAIYASLAWSLVGFGLWYGKLQAPLDNKLKLEAEVTTAELQIKKKQLQESAASKAASEIQKQSP